MPTQVEFEQTELERQYVEGRLHFAIAGTAGSGKSSLINAFRGVSKGTASAAATGVVETTTSIGRYDDPHPDRSKFVSRACTALTPSSSSSIHVLSIPISPSSRTVKSSTFRPLSFEANRTAIADEMREELDEDESEDEEDVRSKDREARRTRVDADAKTQYISQTRRNVGEDLRKVGLDARGVELRD
ncbi:hypothetical protein D9757_008611 [Collybiopsis confluens]|uniref:IRG-type G domain-containing protein n=1 Tax=Collybiopsis confluens TaxID=2823264 RepID=A0A8H5MA22_9AGAR|nr:hypothetical protein D9757_008611 [Collybiopsis confluens]